MSWYEWLGLLGIAAMWGAVIVLIVALCVTAARSDRREVDR